MISGKRDDMTNYGAAAMVTQGHSQARKRVLLFLTAFVITGFFSKFSHGYYYEQTFYVLPFFSYY